MSRGLRPFPTPGVDLAQVEIRIHGIDVEFDGCLKTRLGFLRATHLQQSGPKPHASINQSWIGEGCLFEIHESRFGLRRLKKHLTNLEWGHRVIGHGRRSSVESDPSGDAISRFACRGSDAVVEVECAAPVSIGEIDPASNFVDPGEADHCHRRR